jgi:hypothetical protein
MFYPDHSRDMRPPLCINQPGWGEAEFPVVHITPTRRVRSDDGQRTER